MANASWSNAAARAPRTGPRPGWDRMISASGCCSKVGFDLPLQAGDLLVQGGQDANQGPDRGGVCRGHDVGLAQVSGT
jgi:hypothetical protein